MRLNFYYQNFLLTAHFTAELWVREANGPEFVSTNFTFYDCKSFNSCSECVASDFPCDWCLRGNRCTHDPSSNCIRDALVTGVGHPGPSIKRGPQFCPRILPGLESTEIMKAFGTSSIIKVKVDSIAQMIARSRFSCQLNVQNVLTRVDAQLLGDTIYCDAMQFSYLMPQAEANGTFSVIWDGSKTLDNPEKIHVLVYHCRLMADNCGRCILLPEKYGCGWCFSSNTCEVAERCSQQSKWRSSSQICPNPSITGFSPSTGPLEGGTNVTIRGEKLCVNTKFIKFIF